MTFIFKHGLTQAPARGTGAEAGIDQSTRPPRTEEGTASGHSGVFTFGDEWNRSLGAVGDGNSELTSPEKDERSNSLPTNVADEQHAGRSGSGRAPQLSDSPNTPPIFRFTSQSSVSGANGSDAAPGLHQWDQSTLTTPNVDNETIASFRGLHNITPCRFLPVTSRLSLAPVPRLGRRLARKSWSEPSVNDPSGQPGSSRLVVPSQQGPEDAPPITRARSQSEVPETLPKAKSPALPYDVLDEEVPPHPFFANSFQTTLQKGIEIAKRTVQTISSIPWVRDSALDALLEDAKGLCVFHGSDTRTVAVLGDSGQGK